MSDCCCSGSSCDRCCSEQSRRNVRDIVADTITTNTLKARTITTQVLNATTINLPRLDIFLPDLNEVLGVDTGGFFSFSRVGDAVTVQLNATMGGIVINGTIMTFDVPAPYAMDGLGSNFLTFPITICVNSVQTVGTLIVVDGQISITLETFLAFTPGDTIAIFPTAVTYLVLA